MKKAAFVIVVTTFLMSTVQA